MGGCVPDDMDRLQELELREHEALQKRARLPQPTRRLRDDCEDCGEPIDPRRLMAIPGALRCIGCEEVRARRMRFMGRPQA